MAVAGGWRSGTCSRWHLCKRSTAKTGRMGYALSETGPAEDVRGALALVERNEAPLGIVYGSDAVASKG